MDRLDPTTLRNLDSFETFTEAAYVEPIESNEWWIEFYA